MTGNRKKRFSHIFAILFFCVLSATGSADDQSIQKSLPENNLEDWMGKGEPGEVYYFFIPQSKDDADRYTYVYDTKLDRLLLFPGQKDLIGRIKGQEIDPEDWPRLLNDLIYSPEADSSKAKPGIFSHLKVIELNENWVKFSLGGRHIVLPRQLMVEEWREKNFPLSEDYVPDDLVKIDQKWNFHTPDNPKFLRKYVAFVIERMLQTAEEQGFHIRVFSAFRSYEKQRYLYLSAVSRYGENQNGVAAPGHSEHQLGTAVDLCGLDPATVLSPDFDRTKEGRWLKENAPTFGFSQSYTRENQHRTGYIPEPWHFRFLHKERR